MVKKGIHIIVITIICYGFLVATHKGEFWPLSIYPMFSQAGKPWTRALVRDVSDSPYPPSPDWKDVTKKNLPGKVFALNEIGINQNDLANFISKNKNWSAQQIRGLRKYFKDKLDDRNFLIFRVGGKLSDNASDSVAINYTPYIFLRNDTTIFNPKLNDTYTVK